MIKIDLNRWFKSIDLNQIHPGLYGMYCGSTVRSRVKVTIYSL